MDQHDVSRCRTARTIHAVRPLVFVANVVRDPRCSYTPDEFPIVGVMDGHRQYIIAGMAGSGTAVSFNGGRCIVNRILERTAEADDYPAEYFSPTRLGTQALLKSLD